MKDFRSTSAGAQEPPKGVAELLSFALSASWRARWLILAGLIAATATVFALTGAPAKESWTATAVIRAGTMPQLAVLSGSECGAVASEPIEEVHLTLSRLTDPSLRESVRNAVAAASAAAVAPGAERVSSLRGVVVNNELLRIDVLGASSGAVVTALETAVAIIQQAHAEIAKRRLDLIDVALHAAEQRLAAISFFTASAKSSADHLLAGVNSAALVTSLRGSDSACLVSLMMASRAVEPTRIMYGTQIALSGPRESWQLRAALLAGVVTLLAAVVLTMAAIAWR